MGTFLDLNLLTKVLYFLINHFILSNLSPSPMSRSFLVYSPDPIVRTPWENPHQLIRLQGDAGGREKGFVYIKVRKFHCWAGIVTVCLAGGTGTHHAIFKAFSQPPVSACTKPLRDFDNFNVMKWQTDLFMHAYTSTISVGLTWAMRHCYAS